MPDKYIVCERQYEASKYNAGSKARTDAEDILISEGFQSLLIESENKQPRSSLEKLYIHFENFLNWKKAFRRVQNGDMIVIQYPIRSHTMFIGKILKYLKKHNVFIIGIIHDLESLRLAIQPDQSQKARFRLQIEEISALKYFNKIVVHNDRMKSVLQEKLGVHSDKMLPLGIFDYLYEPKETSDNAYPDGAVLIAGNLDKRKSGYVYRLPGNVRFELFGANYDESFQQTNVIYRGKVVPDDLPGLLKGSFGLVWDGPSAESCEGVFGEYLKYNNPHKCSLYLAAGLPVIIWKQAALAPFIEGNHLGFCVNSLDEIDSVLDSITDEEYKTISQNCCEIGKKIRSGYFLTKALRNIMGIENHK